MFTYHNSDKTPKKTMLISLMIYSFWLLFSKNFDVNVYLKCHLSRKYIKLKHKDLLNIQNDKRENIKIIINLSYWLYTDIFQTGNAKLKGKWDVYYSCSLLFHTKSSNQLFSILLISNCALLFDVYCILPKTETETNLSTKISY